MRVVKWMIISVSLVAGLAQAVTLEESSRVMCDKVKQCALQQIQVGDGQLPDAIKQMVEQQVEGMCSQMQAKFPQAGGHPLAGDAIGCMQSVNTLSCDVLMTPEGIKTPACVAFREKAENYRVQHQ